MNKKSFILYLDQQELFNKLPDDLAGKLIKHIFSYVNCEDPTTDDLVLDIAFESIKQALKRDLDKWDKQLLQRSEAGKKSAEARAAKAKQNATKSTSVKSRSTNPTDSVNVSVNVSVSDKDKELFVCFWDAYPRKTDKKKANKAFDRLTDENKGRAIADILTRFSNTEKQFIPHATTYLNGERWNDEAISNEENNRNTKRNLTAVERVDKACRAREIEVENNRQDDIPALEQDGTYIRP